MKKISTFIVLIAIAVSSYSQKMMLGPPDCGEWFEMQSAKPWLSGYLSGINGSGFFPDGTDIIDGMSGAQIFLWVDNYCKANPLKTVPQAANQLIRELYTKAKKH